MTEKTKIEKTFPQPKTIFRCDNCGKQCGPDTCCEGWRVVEYTRTDTLQTLKSGVDLEEQYLYLPHDKSAALEALDYIEDHTKYLSSIHPSLFDTIRAALSERGVDMGPLTVGLMNAVKPVYSEENGEWCLWCGQENHAQAILDAARLVERQGLTTPPVVGDKVLRRIKKISDAEYNRPVDAVLQMKLISAIIEKTFGNSASGERE